MPYWASTHLVEHVLSPDLVTSRSHEVAYWNNRVALKFDGHLCSTICQYSGHMQRPIKWNILRSNIVLVKKISLQKYAKSEENRNV